MNRDAKKRNKKFKKYFKEKFFSDHLIKINNGIVYEDCDCGTCETIVHMTGKDKDYTFFKMEEKSLSLEYRGLTRIDIVICRRYIKSILENLYNLILQSDCYNIKLLSKEKDQYDKIYNFIYNFSEKVDFYGTYKTLIKFGDNVFYLYYKLHTDVLEFLIIDYFDINTKDIERDIEKELLYEKATNKLIDTYSYNNPNCYIKNYWIDENGKDIVIHVVDMSTLDQKIKEYRIPLFIDYDKPSNFRIVNRY